MLITARAGKASITPSPAGNSSFTEQSHIIEYT
jgi:hypothetical protein